MFIKKKNVSSKLKEIVNQTNCSPARLLQLLAEVRGFSGKSF